MSKIVSEYSTGLITGVILSTLFLCSSIVIIGKITTHLEEDEIVRKHYKELRDCLVREKEEEFRNHSFLYRKNDSLMSLIGKQIKK